MSTATFVIPEGARKAGGMDRGTRDRGPAGAGVDLERDSGDLGAAGAPAMGVFGRVAVFAYSLVGYAMFLVAFTYAIGFVTGLVVPKDVNAGVAGELLPSMVVNGLLLGLFAVQHTIMARPRFKAWWTRIIPASAERSTFVVFAASILFLLYWQWRPMPGLVWSVEDPVARGAIYAVGAGGWLLALASSFLINHFDLFGLRQAWLNLVGRPYTHVPFRVTGPYKFVRHPLMLGFLTAFWATPTMTVGHLFFAAVVTGYVLFGTWIEERDLLTQLGEPYRQYRRHVPLLIPGRRAGR